MGLCCSMYAKNQKGGGNLEGAMTVINSNAAAMLQVGEVDHVPRCYVPKEQHNGNARVEATAMKTS